MGNRIQERGFNALLLFAPSSVIVGPPNHHCRLFMNREDMGKKTNLLLLHCSALILAHEVLCSNLGSMTDAVTGKGCGSMFEHMLCTLKIPVESLMSPDTPEKDPSLEILENHCKAVSIILIQRDQFSDSCDPIKARNFKSHGMQTFHKSQDHN